MDNAKFHSDEEIDAILEELSHLTSAQAAPAGEPPNALDFVKSREKINWKAELLEWLKMLILAFAVLLLVFHFLIRIVSVEGQSMEPTLYAQDRLVISNLFYTPQSGDIVVLSDQNGLSEPLVKRVVATGGQTVDISPAGLVFVDGHEFTEGSVGDFLTAPGEQSYPLVVPEGKLFLMGDNRDHSTDSRYMVIGCLDAKEVLGHVLFRFLPISRLGSID